MKCLYRKLKGKLKALQNQEFSLAQREYQPHSVAHTYDTHMRTHSSCIYTCLQVYTRNRYAATCTGTYVPKTVNNQRDCRSNLCCARVWTHLHHLQLTDIFNRYIEYVFEDSETTSRYVILSFDVLIITSIIRHIGAPLRATLRNWKETA